MRHSEALSRVNAKLRDATERYGSFKSEHEGLAIIEEEFLEFRQEVFRKYQKRNIYSPATEVTQLAAMAIRFLIDCVEEAK